MSGRFRLVLVACTRDLNDLAPDWLRVDCCSQWVRLPIHWAAVKKAPAHIIEGLLVAYPEGARIKDSCPQVVPADLSKHPPTRRMIQQCAVDPIGWRAAFVADCVDSGERAHPERNSDHAIASYHHGLRVVPTHERLQQGLLHTRKLQSDERVTALLAWQKGG